ncbi:MAG: hypothetical protein ABEK04_02710, partial [Candidatus Nanohalobium sp.]
NLEQQDGGIPAMTPLDGQIKEGDHDLTAYVADPLPVYTNRITTDEVEREEDQGLIDSVLGKDPETYVEEVENSESVWALAQERDFFDDYDNNGQNTVSYAHIPFTVGGSDVRTRGGNSARWER